MQKYKHCFVCNRVNIKHFSRTKIFVLRLLNIAINQTEFWWVRSATHGKFTEEYEGFFKSLLMILPKVRHYETGPKTRFNQWKHTDSPVRLNSGRSSQ